MFPYPAAYRGQPHTAHQPGRVSSAGRRRRASSLAADIAEELFLVAYNPFISASATCQKPAWTRAIRPESPGPGAPVRHRPSAKASPCSGARYEAGSGLPPVSSSVRLAAVMPADCVHAPGRGCAGGRRHRRHGPAHGAAPAGGGARHGRTGRRALVRLANDMKFALIPRGGGFRA